MEKKAHRRRLWSMLGKDQYIREIWEYHSCVRSKAKKFREDAEKEKLEGIQGQWQRESPAMAYLEQVKCCKDIDCTPRMMKQAFLALKGEGTGEYTKISSESKRKPRNGLLTEQRKSSRRRKKDEARKLSTVQEIMLRSTDYLRRIIAPAGGQGGVTMSYLCPHCWWVSPVKKHESWWCAI